MDGMNYTGWPPREAQNELPPLRAGVYPTEYPGVYREVYPPEAYPPAYLPAVNPPAAYSEVAVGQHVVGRDDFEDDYHEGEEAEDDECGEPIPDEEKTPVTIVTGFLGSGKTTLVNYILREQREMKIAVIENEFGAVSIDTTLVEENVREAEDIVTMDNGCVCCTIRGDLVKTLVKFLDRRQTFDCILLETTGIADPSPILATFNEDFEVKDNYRVDSVLCLVDAKNVLRQLQRTVSLEEGAVNEAVQQLAFADTVIVNKTDLVSEEELGVVKDKINSVNAFAKVVEAQKSRVPLKSVLNLRSYNLERTLELIDQEAKEEEARRRAAKQAEAEQAEAEKKAKESDGKKGSCGDPSCLHDHSHGNHEHKHEKEHANGHGNHEHKHEKEHANGHGNHEQHTNGGEHDNERGEQNVNGHAEKRKRHDDGADAAAGMKTKKPKEGVAVSSRRHDSKVGSMALTLRGSLDVDMFNKFIGAFLRDNGEDLFRSKGVLSFKDLDRKWVFQGVHDQINCEPSVTGWAEDGSDRESKIVFIGLDLDKDYITEELTACLVPAAEA